MMLQEWFKKQRLMENNKTRQGGIYSLQYSIEMLI